MDGETAWIAFTIYPNEDEASLKAEFVKLRHKHPDRDPVEVTKYIFQQLKSPERYLQAAALWRDDIELKERISELGRMGLPGVDTSLDGLLKRSLAVADDPDAAHRDKIAAIRLAGELQGFVKKGVETGKPGSANDNSVADTMAELAKRLPN